MSESERRGPCDTSAKPKSISGLCYHEKDERFTAFAEPNPEGWTAESFRKARVLVFKSKFQRLRHQIPTPPSPSRNHHWSSSSPTSWSFDHRGECHASSTGSTTTPARESQYGYTVDDDAEDQIECTGRHDKSFSGVALCCCSCALVSSTSGGPPPLRIAIKKKKKTMCEICNQRFAASGQLFDRGLRERSTPV
ncbi:hypothetical protein COP2_031820 [Malus domestica]